MHEYVHEYFQYGRPEYINKITRKALALRKSPKPKSICNNEDQLLYLSPLQKARKNLREALRKAAQDLIIPNSAKQFCNLNLENEDPQDEICESEENIDLDWLNTKSCCKPTEQIPNPDLKGMSKHTKISVDNTKITGDTDQEESLITFKDTNEQSSDNFSASFLSMPDLDPEPHQDKTGAELLAEFKIDHDQSIMDEIEQNKENIQNSLNCVLPSINNDPNDDVSMERDSGNLGHYNGEWDQMFNDIITNKVNSQDCGTDLKELYSQISRTIDLLNV
ncbi:hypothetical protein evm_006551 [Chilo suppressalis]|nr:hypothetical protein evm_006551 [Chilo suppressalis]